MISSNINAGAFLVFFSFHRARDVFFLVHLSFLSFVRSQEQSDSVCMNRIETVGLLGRWNFISADLGFLRQAWFLNFNPQ